MIHCVIQNVKTDARIYTGYFLKDSMLLQGNRHIDKPGAVGMTRLA